MTETLMTAPPSELRGAFRQLAVAETYLQDGEIKVKDSFPICPSFGVVWYREVDLGFPDVRSSVQDNPESDGTFDSTRYIGAREVSITGVVIENAFGDLPDTEEWPPEVAWNSASWFCTLLSSWASPARRYRFYFHDGIRSRFMDCRGDSFSVNADRNGGEFREFQLGMVNPSGRIYTFAEGEGTTEDGRYAVDIRAAAADVAGRSYLLTYPRVYPTVSGTGASAVFYTGTIPTGFVAEIYTGSSPLTGPRITVTDPFGNVQSIGLGSGFEIPAGTLVTFDTVARTVFMRESSAFEDTSLERWLAAPLQWPQLRPGLNPLTTDLAATRPGYNQISYSQVGGSPDPSLRITVKHYPADLA